MISDALGSTGQDGCRNRVPEGSHRGIQAWIVIGRKERAQIVTSKQRIRRRGDGEVPHVMQLPPKNVAKRPLQMRSGTGRSTERQMEERFYSPVLRTRRTVQVDDEFQAVVLSPAYGFAEIGELALDVWLAARDIPGPKADRKADMVETEV